MCGTVTDIAKLSPNIKCTTSCYEYYDDLQCSNLLFISSTLFSFLGAYRSLLKNSTERFIKNSKERFTKILLEKAVAMILCTNNIGQRLFRKHILCLS